MDTTQLFILPWRELSEEKLFLLDWVFVFAEEVAVDFEPIKGTLNALSFSMRRPNVFTSAHAFFHKASLCEHGCKVADAAVEFADC